MNGASELVKEEAIMSLRELDDLSEGKILNYISANKSLKGISYEKALELTERNEITTYLKIFRSTKN